MDILYLSPADWNGPRGRFQHIALRLAQNNRVMYADGLGVRSIGASDWRRSASKVLSSLRPVGARAEGNVELYHITPLAIPGQSPKKQQLNRSLLFHFISGHLRQRRFHDPLVWIAYPHPDLVAILDRFQPRAVIYDCVDQWSQFRRAYANLGATEEALTRRADLVFATAPPLQERLSKLNPRTFLVPNGVDVELFDGASRTVPEDIASIPRPRIGFVGNIAEWVDMDLIQGIARSHADWQLVFVGDYLSDSPRPVGDNIHWMGYRRYDDVPGYVGSFDACIIPFHDDELTRGVDPLKLYEYLAAGKPVVSTPLPRSSEFSEVVSIARSTEEFVSALDDVLHDDDSSNERRVAAARPHSWSGRLKTITDLTREHLALEL